MMNLFLFLLFLGFLWLGVIKYACVLEENKKEKERKENGNLSDAEKADKRNLEILKKW
jgi:Flp pilus assembly protein TadB